jgi:hypothetical protein
MRLLISRILTVTALAGLIACSQSSPPTARHRRVPHAKKRYGTIYHGADGHYYTRSVNDDGTFWYWMYVMNAQDSSKPTATVPDLTGGTWSRMTAPPSDLTATSKVVTEQNGTPTQEVAEESTVPDQETITESTTPTEAQAMDSTDVDTGGESTADFDSGSDTGGDAGGSDSGGGDGGGGDGGGGGD